ncbi:hypothetical protein AGRO_1231 [Agrobacterium sp. ATCC 31749]|nr:hypothetical protein AGRO_1231 [Agrobacterium sp. ATCC 31749]
MAPDIEVGFERTFGKKATLGKLIWNEFV